MCSTYDNYNVIRYLFTCVVFTIVPYMVTLMSQDISVPYSIDSIGHQCSTYGKYPLQCHRIALCHFQTITNLTHYFSLIWQDILISSSLFVWVLFCLWLIYILRTHYTLALEKNLTVFVKAKGVRFIKGTCMCT